MKTNRRPQIVRLLAGSPRTIAEISNAIDLSYSQTKGILRQLLKENVIELYTISGTKPIKYYVPLRRTK
jgi:predicted transcriptional regulator